MSEIVFKNVSKFFGDTKVIEDLNLTLKDGEFTVLVGASGCGKTTLLRMIAGIGPATSGEIYMDGEDISQVPPGKNKKIPKEERDRRIASVAETVGLTPYLGRKPGALSGGQRQRVALARAMVKNPKVFLMDEPLSNLDAKLRVSMRTELIELHRRVKTSFVYVTHDQAEAMSMADTIILMDGGKIMQQASPEVIYNDPDNVFTAQFVGTPAMNVIRAKDGESFIGYRPEKVMLGRNRGGALYCRRGLILTREMLGSETLYKVRLEKGEWEGEEPVNVMVKSQDPGFLEGEPVEVSVEKESLYFFDKNENRIRPGGGTDMEIYYDMARDIPAKAGGKE